MNIHELNALIKAIPATDHEMIDFYTAQREKLMKEINDEINKILVSA